MRIDKSTTANQIGGIYAFSWVIVLPSQFSTFFIWITAKSAR